MKKFLIGAVLLLFSVLYFWQKDTNKIDQNAPGSQSITAVQKQEAAKKQTTTQTTADLIHFTVTKTAKMLLLSGTFTDRKQSKHFARNLRPTYSTVHIKEDATLTDQGGMTLAAKILPLFKKSYIEGEIRYEQGIFTLKGTVRSQKIFDQMNTLLKNADIPLKNLTILDTKAVLPSPVKRQTHKPKRKVQHSKKSKHIIRTQNHTETDNKPLPAKHVASKQQVQKPSKQKMPQTKQQNKIPADNHTKQQKKTPADTTMPAKTRNKSRTAAKKSISVLLKQHRIGFLPAKGTLTPQGEKAVDALANILSRYPSIHVEIAGYTDSDGSESFNQKLSQKRVDAVKKRLISRGINPKRLRAKGYGESHPLVPNTSDENKQKNRRVEINILKVLKI